MRPMLPTAFPVIAALLTLLAPPSSVLARIEPPASRSAPAFPPSLIRNGMIPLTVSALPGSGGNVARRPTDLLLLLPQAGDPLVPGLDFGAGGSITVTLPTPFTRNVGRPLKVTVPRFRTQAGLCCYTTKADGNTVTITFTRPVRTTGVSAPGVKVLARIQGQAYTNPGPGRYTVAAQVVPVPGHPPIPAGGVVTIVPAAP